MEREKKEKRRNDKTPPRHKQAAEIFFSSGDNNEQTGNSRRLYHFNLSNLNATFNLPFMAFISRPYHLM